MSIVRRRVVGTFSGPLVVLRGRPPKKLTPVRPIARNIENIGGYAHQEAPVEKVVEALRPKRDLSRSPLFQVMFVYQNSPVADTPYITSRLSGRRIMSSSEYVLICRETSDGLFGRMEYDPHAFSLEAANGFLASVSLRLRSDWFEGVDFENQPDELSVR